MPKLESVSSSTLSSAAGAEKAGQPHPESYFASELKSSAPQQAQWYVPVSKTWSYSPVNGRSVPFSRSTWYCSGVSSARHCSSVFLIFSTLFGLRNLEIVTNQGTLGDAWAGSPWSRQLPLRSLRALLPHTRLWSRGL